MKSCDCEEWKVGIKSMIQQSLMAALHGRQDSGPMFRFCPWCGRELTEKPRGE